MAEPKRGWIYFFGQGQADGGSDLKHLIGGKGASLAEMTKAGLNVPPGFTISAECCDLFFKNQRQWPADLLQQVHAAIDRLQSMTRRWFGQGEDPLLVAVRSGAAQSMPGMMDTVLNVGLVPSDQPHDPWRQLTESITAVFDSWNSERAVAYRRHHGIEGLLGTAVTVQSMCPAEVAGVMFTANPVNHELNHIIIESSFGLGEALVLGKITPDRFVLNKNDLAIQERTITRKDNDATLNDDQVQRLAELGLRVEAYFQHPCDIEWALAGGEFFLLQARPIKQRTPERQPIKPAEVEKVRQEEITALRGKAAPEGTVWSRFNLSEVLPEPTPMTWSIAQRFLAGQGGYGLMYRDLGYDPDPSLAEEGVFDLVCGRPYCNLTREPRMQYGSMPFDHNFAQLKAVPAKAIYPQAQFNPRRASVGFWLKIPWLALKQWWRESNRQRLLRTFADCFEQAIVPRFLAEVEVALKEDWQSLSNAALVEKLHHWISRSLVDFARDSLKPTALAAILLAKFEAAFARRFQPQGTKVKTGELTGQERAQRAVQELTMGAHPAVNADLAGAFQRRAAGTLSEEEFYEQFGHRGPQEMELAQPRWSENRHVAAAGHVSMRAEDTSFAERWKRIAAELRLAPFQIPFVERELNNLRRLMGLREAGKHYMLRGYALIRRALVELDRRFDLDEGIFFLELTDVPSLLASEQDASMRKDIDEQIAQRRRRREIALSMATPQVLFSDALEAIGRDVHIASAETMQGVPLSAGSAEGRAWVLHEATGAQPPADDYILVCPSTDPAWMPLFVGARGLVMETGGVLSHGAIVAREFGLPAVAGIPEVHHRLKTGQRLHIDGAAGVVNVLAG